MQISAGLAYLDQTAPFRAGGVSEVTCRMSKTYLLAAALVCKNQLAQVGPDFDKFRACVTQINMQALLCARVRLYDYIYILR